MTITVTGVIVILLFSALLQATIGFGSAVVAMPLLVMIIPVRLATPVVALTSVILNIAVVAASWRQVDWRTVWRLVLCSLPGIPLGMLLLLYAPEAWVKALLGIILVGFGVYQLLPLHLPHLENDRWIFPFAATSGVLGGAYNINVPPLLVYGALRRWRPDAFRTNLIGFFLPNGMLAALGHAAGGLWNPDVWQLVLLAAPCMLLAAGLGGRLNHRISPQAFTRLLPWITIALGGLLLVSVLH